MELRRKSIASDKTRKPSIARGLSILLCDYDAGQVTPAVSAVATSRFAPVESMHQ